LIVVVIYHNFLDHQSARPSIADSLRYGEISLLPDQSVKYAYSGTHRSIFAYITSSPTSSGGQCLLSVLRRASEGQLLHSTHQAPRCLHSLSACVAIAYSYTTNIFPLNSFTMEHISSTENRSTSYCHHPAPDRTSNGQGQIIDITKSRRYTCMLALNVKCIPPSSQDSDSLSLYQAPSNFPSPTKPQIVKPMFLQGANVPKPKRHGQSRPPQIGWTGCLLVWEHSSMTAPSVGAS
jgi:hypothetical protein